MDYGLILRFVLGWAAIVMAGAQLSMRYILTQQMNGPLRKTAFASSVTAGLLLIGVGVGNLTHLNAPATLSTFILSAGVISSVWTLETIWRAANPNGGTQ